MRSYLITGNQIAVHPSAPKSVPKDSMLIRRIDDFDAGRFPASRLVSIWNTLPDVDSIKGFKSRSVGLKRLWDAMQSLPLGSSRADSKQAQLVSLLRRNEGASLSELMSVTGWQAHSVRGALSGVLRKKLGLDIERVVTGNTKVYRIADAA